MMEHRDMEPVTTTAPAREPIAARYEPPAVAWEEEFSSVAASDCTINPDSPECFQP
jgi:hypothetical protein